MLNLSSPHSWLKLQETFENALALPLSERERFLQTLDEDASFLVKLRKMLLFAETSSDAIDSAIHTALSQLESPEAILGKKIGSYRLISLLGEGGMGAVYLAERDDEEFRHRVAIKLIRRNLNHPELVTLFENERQILADMNHPHICRLMDGGRTEDGQIYFVMEYVPGIPIDRHCEANQVPRSKRLELFLRVCETVQDLHQKLVIHCDLKPSNILISEEGELKLLDFGIAKVSSPQGNEDISSHSHSRAYTLEYSSPEQVLGQRLDVTSDIYSLGNIFYKLLTGQNPSAFSRLEMEKTRLMKNSRSTFSLQKSRNNEVHPQLLAIYLHATDPLSQARYPTVTSMMDDIRRYLCHYPILCSPPTFLFRLVCWYRRNRIRFLSISMACLFICGWVYREHRLSTKLEKAAASDREVAMFLANIFRNLDPFSYNGKPLTGLDILDKAMKQIDKSKNLESETAVRLKVQLASSYRALGESTKAENILLSALNTDISPTSSDQEKRATLFAALAENASQAFQYDKARDWFQKSEPLWIDAKYSSSFLDFLNHYSQFLINQFELIKAKNLNHKALALCDSQFSVMQETCVNSQLIKAKILGHENRLIEATKEFESVLSKQKLLFGEKNLYVLLSLTSYIEMLRQNNQFNGIEEKMLESVELVKDIHPPGHPFRNKVFNVLANYYHDQARYQEALTIYKQMQAETEGSHYKSGMPFSAIVNNMALVYSERELYEEAWPLFQQTFDLMSSQYPPDSPFISYSYQQLGFISILRQQYQEAELFLKKALALRLKEKDKLSQALTTEQLALLYLRLGRISEAKNHMRQAWILSKGLFVQDDMREARFSATEAQIQFASGDRDGASKSIEYSLSIVRQARSVNHPIFAKYLIKRAEYLSNKEDLKTAIAILERDLESNAMSLKIARDMLSTWTSIH